MSALKFFREFVLQPHKVGAVSASSRELAETIASAASVHDAAFVVEFGPGTGAITSVVSDALPCDSRLVAFEINPSFCDHLRQKYPAHSIIEDSAVNASKHLQRDGDANCDSVICGLPLAVFDGPMQDDLIGQAHNVLRRGGKFVAFSYLHSPFLPGGRRLPGKLFSQFTKVEKTPIVWRNLPPAFVYTAEK